MDSVGSTVLFFVCVHTLQLFSNQPDLKNVNRHLPLKIDPSSQIYVSVVFCISLLSDVLRELKREKMQARMAILPLLQAEEDLR